MVITLARETRMDAISKFMYRRVYFNFNKSSTYSQLKSDRVFTAKAHFFGVSLYQVIPFCHPRSRR